MIVPQLINLTGAAGDSIIGASSLRNREIIKIPVE